MEKLKFKAFFKGVEINDNDLFNPDKIYSERNNSSHSNSYECIICSHGILWTNKIIERDNYIDLKKDGKTGTYYQDWESLQLLSKDVVIEVVV